MKQAQFTHQLVEYIPEKLDDGVLYVSERFKTALHRCACGCGEEVVTPLSRAEWMVSVKPSGPTLMPSIGNWSFACRSHYFIRDGKVVWARDMSKTDIERGRRRDARLHSEHAASKVGQETAEVAKLRPGAFQRISQWLLSRFISKRD